MLHMSKQEGPPTLVKPMEPLPFIQLVVTRTWQHRDPNPGPLAWDASALPTELAILPVDVRSSVYVLKDKFHVRGWGMESTCIIHPYGH